MRFYNLLSVLIFLSLISCNNEERRIAGEYVLDSCYVDTSININLMPEIITLSLYANKTFVINGKDIHLHGTWKYYDSGDHTIVGLYIENSDYENQALLGENENGNFQLWIMNPNILFNRDNIKYLTFRSKMKASSQP